MIVTDVAPQALLLAFFEGVIRGCSEAISLAECLIHQRHEVGVVVSTVAYHTGK